MSDTKIIFPDNDNLISWSWMERASDGEFVDDATVTATLLDPDGVEVTGVIDLPMDYVTGSNGIYQGILPFDIDWDLAPSGSGYHLLIIANSPTSGHAERNLDCVVVERTT
jgi:hypothetical protein